ncbi:MAG: DUF2147 domain-containing protein [Reichenbachiella sp.]|uniref:DUF2147 domain-containing protein n=1 Tax=Reichenbachiella sp. TaxID=2184521 RepID=UPI0032973DD3
MQRLILLVAGVLLGINAYAQTTEDKILGKWTNPDKSRVIEFVKNGDNYEAIIRESDEASFVGKKQITNLSFEKDGAYEDGTVHILQRNKTADCTTHLLSIDELELKVSFGLMSKSVIWTRVDN